MWHYLRVLIYVDLNNILCLLLGQFRPIGTYYTVAPVQIADIRVESVGHIIITGRRLRHRRKAKAMSSP